MNNERAGRAPQGAADLYSATAAVMSAEGERLAPRINHPRVHGVRPGRPLLFTLPISGARPLRVEASGLPPGVSLDAATGILRGSTSAPGEHVVTVSVTNAHGNDTAAIRIVVGPRHTLTPPMGWNSWNCWGGAVTEEKVLEAAQAFVSRGLSHYGWSYVNIDDGWQGVRGGPRNAIQPNAKFGDIGRLAASVHQLGMKVGIYSSPWRGTYEGHIGSSCDRPDGIYDWAEAGDHNGFYRIGSGGTDDWDRKRRLQYAYGRYSFVAQDVAQWAEWGIDFLKYDWKPNDRPHTEEIANALNHANRDVVLSLSNKAPYWEARSWCELANCWRTTADIQDTWASVSGIGFHQDRWAGFAGPGHWNDPDMLVLGQVGWGPTVRPTRLTQEEQCAHFSLWCLLAAPLLVGCDLAQLDEFTLRLLTNSEVIGVNQDRLGRQAVRVGGDAHSTVMAKQLADGSIAVGLFNLGATPHEVVFDWDDLHLAGPRSVRDLWMRRDEGVFDARISAVLPSHGVKLVQLGTPP